MRKAQARAAAGDETATLAFDVFIHRLVTGIGAMTAAAGGLDALVFPGGIGEHSPAVRAAAVATHRLGHLGVRIDAGHNDEAEHDADISHKQASVRTLVVTAREDLQIARETAVCSTSATRPPPRLRRMEPDSDPPPDPGRIARFALALFACLPGSGRSAAMEV